jgi:HK97 family phage major capsid protein
VWQKLQIEIQEIFVKLIELKAARAAASARAQLLAKEMDSGATPEKKADFDRCMSEIRGADAHIERLEKNNTITSAFPTLRTQGFLVTDDGDGPTRKTLSAEYRKAFHEWVATGGKTISAALYEGSNVGGGYAVPIVVDDQIVPLAPQEMAVRQISMVIPTVSDIKVPQKGSFGVASAKAENSSFTEIDPTLSQFTLSAFMSGIQETISWELAQDVPNFQNFCVDDMVLAQQMYEENLYINGTGSGQAQGLIGNVGAGVVEEPDTAGNLVSINGTLDLLAKLNAVYHPGASWLMSRATSVIIRKAQTEANLFNPAWTRVGTQDYLHGYPVFYSASMPVAARGNTPVLFGNFKMGYVIGDRGGSGINVKVLDQPAAQQGQIILLAYRRTDGRVRRSEAIQSYTIASS